MAPGDKVKYLRLAPSINLMRFIKFNLNLQNFGNRSHGKIDFLNIKKEKNGKNV